LWQGSPCFQRTGSEVEVLAYLAGEAYYRRGKLERIVVREFLYPEVFEKQTVDEVRISTEELARLKEKAEPLQIVGTLHSHPHGEQEPQPESGPSCTDIQGAVQDRELVYGVYSIWKNPGKRARTRLFWATGPPNSGDPMNNP